MNILFCCIVPKSELYLGLAKEFKRRGHTITFFSPSDDLTTHWGMVCDFQALFFECGPVLSSNILKKGVANLRFPVCTITLLGHELAYSGGGYFRFFPLSFVKKEMSKTDYSMTYFHIGDLVPEMSGIMDKDTFEKYYKIPGTLKNRTLRYVKTNLGKKSAFGKLLSLIATKEFVNLEQADKIIDWEKAPSVVL